MVVSPIHARCGATATAGVLLEYGASTQNTDINGALVAVCSTPCVAVVSLDTHACGAGRTPLHYAYNQLEVINECVSWMVEQVGAPVDYTGPVESDEPVPSNVHIHRFGDPLDEVRVQTSLLLVAG